MTEREAGAGLGAGHGEIPAARAGMTDLFARVWRTFVLGWRKWAGAAEALAGAGEVGY